ncbi:MAG: formylglycine-generating enzyme family protein [Planctomycetia bacterium]|nr:formylglycine-generating enzyme family protein [Planctomycetia bacterium]
MLPALGASLLTSGKFSAKIADVMFVRTTGYVLAAVLLASSPAVCAAAPVMPREAIGALLTLQILGGNFPAARYSVDGTPEAEDYILLNSGDHITGHIVEITPAGTVRLENPFLAGGALVPLRNVQQIVPARKKRILDGPDSVLLTTGNRILGTIEEINPRVVVLQTRSMGRVSIKRGFVASVRFQASENVIFETDFSTGTFAPWERRAGRWEMRDGKLHCLTPLSYVSAAVKHEGPVTVEWTVSKLLPHANSSMLFFVQDSRAGVWGGKAIYLQPRWDAIRISPCVPGSIVWKKFGRIITRATFRAAYNPENGLMRIWVNDMDLGQVRLRPALKRGTAMHLYCRNPSIYESVRLLRGAEAVGSKQQAHQTRDRFIMTNNDNLSGTLKGFGKNIVVVETSHGTLRVPKAEMQRIIFHTADLQVPRPNAGDVTIIFHTDAAFTATLKRMDADFIEAKTEFLGEVRISRKSVRQLILPPPYVSLDLGGGASVRFSLVRAGTFLMGPPVPPSVTRGRVGIRRRRVTITKPFYIGVAEVTRGQFAAFVAQTGHKTDAEKAGLSYIRENDKSIEVKGASWRDPRFRQDDSHPVVCVSWNDAQEFCRWLSRKTGKRVHLPTEAQWEYACRAGTRTPYYTGDRITMEQANFDGMPKTGARALGAFLNGTSPVGSYRGNPWGLYDMHGNVAEWCADWHALDFDKPVAADPTGPKTSKLRVARDGGWKSGAGDVRSDARRGLAPLYHSLGLGFRVVMEAE